MRDVSDCANAFTWAWLARVITSFTAATATVSVDRVAAACVAGAPAMASRTAEMAAGRLSRPLKLARRNATIPTTSKRPTLGPGERFGGVAGVIGMVGSGAALVSNMSIA